MDKMLTEKELSVLKARELKPWDETKDAKYIGYIMRAYGDEMYYQFPDGTYGYKYFSIGD